MELWQFLGELHPKLVQFPLVLLPAGLLLDAMGLLRREQRWHWAAKIISGAGTVLLLFAFICGIYAEVWAGRAGIPQHPIEFHEFAANIASWGFVVLMAWRLFLDVGRRRQLAAYIIIGLAWYVLLMLTAYLGGSLVFDYGAAVVGARANTVLSLHDLNTLATRQTDENLRYSEWMHHIFGCMTLALALSLLAQALFPSRGAKLRWVGPALLLAGGIFLFFFADLDLYRLTDLRQLRDREVQLHKALATILVVVGVMGLRRSRRAQQPAAASSKMVAVMALIGGGLLFTHVHTVAPYANVAAGVYVAHVVMGLVALTIGAARLLEDVWPQWRRGLATTFAMFMLIEAVLLLTYNEGLPWYIGYGHYLRDGPHHGTIAPYGALRAELTFDPPTQTLDVYVLSRMANTPVAVAARSLDLIVAQGYDEIAVTITAVEPGEGASHFRATAPFLRSAPAFCARLALPLGEGQRMGYFDPWVTPAIAAIPPNEVALYQCPMHEGILSEHPGTCPLCGMTLVPRQWVAPTTLHDAPYEMDLSTTGDGNTVEMSFMPMKSRKVLRDLVMMHEHLLHLIIVSEDLEFFDHVHPVPQDDGSLVLTYGFPKAGHYLLFADITPQGARSQVFRFPLRVGHAPGPETAARLTPSPVLAHPLAEDPSITVQLIPQPRTLMAGIHSHMLFRLCRDGRPLTDLEPYLSSMGHCMIVSEDTQVFMHCHPEQLEMPGPDARGGPDIPFGVWFARPGRYKLWAQFRRQGKVITVPFVVDVSSPPLPAKFINFILND